MQKYQNDFQLIDNPTERPFNKYEWAFNSEDTDPAVYAEQQKVLENPEADDRQRMLASYVVGRDALRKRLRTEYHVGRLSKAFDSGDETAELLGWFDLLGLSSPEESVEETLKTSCGGRSAKEALQYFRENYKGHVVEGDKEMEKFSGLSPDEKRKFIADLHKNDLTESRIETVSSGFAPNGALMPGGVRSVRREFVREMTDEEFSKWSTEYELDTKYKRFWQAVMGSGERNARIALSLSMTQDEDAREAYIPTLQNLPQKDREEIYWLAREFNPEVNMWNLVKDDFIDSWTDIVRAAKNGKDWLFTGAADLKQYIDENGGLDKIMSDEKAKDAFRNKFFVAESGLFLGVNRFVIPNASDRRQGDKNLRDYANRIYEMGADALELRARADEISEAMKTKYRSQGYVMDGIIQGVSFGAQFGQFVIFTSLTGGTGSVLRGAGAAASATSKVSKASKLAKAANAFDKAAYYGRHARKAALPYFGAMMSVDAQEAAQKAGFSDEQAFLLGVGIGTANTFLERLQFGIRQKNPFLAEKVFGLLNKRKDYTKAVMMQHFVDGVKNRTKHFGEEYLVENLQNVVQEFGLLAAAELSDKEYKEFSQIATELLGQARDMIIPLLTATNIGAGTGFGRAAKTFATAERLRGDEKAMHDFNAEMMIGETVEKMRESGVAALTPDLAMKYIGARSEGERSRILGRISHSPKERAKARKAIEDVRVDLENISEELVKSVQAGVSAADAQIPEGESVSETLNGMKLLEDRTPKMDHAANRAFISDFISAYGLQDEAVYLESLSDAPAEVLESAKAELKNRGKSDAEIERFIYGEGGADGFRNGGKIYIVGNKAITPKRTLEILKHETGHRGAEYIRNTAEFKSFLGDLVSRAGGIDIVREGIRRAKGEAYDNLADMDLAEEYMCMLAEKVAGKNELSEEEKSTWARVYDFFVEALSGIPKNKAQADIYVANMIRALWDRNFLEDAEEWDAEPVAAVDETAEENAAKREAVEARRQERAQKSFKVRIQRRKLESKKLSPEELEYENEKAQVREFLDSIPDDDISAKLEAMETVEDDAMLSDEDLQYAAENGLEWADKLLMERMSRREEEALNAEHEDLLSIMSSNGLKLPTPKAVREDAKRRGLPLSGYLFGEINDLYNSLNFAQQQKYFGSKYVDLDSLASSLSADYGFDFEGSADFLSAFAENIYGQGETRTRFSVAENPKYDAFRKNLHRVLQMGRGEMIKKKIKLGDTPDVLKLIGFEDKPLMLSGKVVWKVAFDPKKARFIPEDTLGKIGEAMERPLFIEQSALTSSNPDNSILVHTELEYNGEKLAVAIHLSKEVDGYVIHNIASIYSRNQNQKNRVLFEKRLLYLDMQRGLSEFSGHGLQSPTENLKDLFVNGKILTESNLSQYNSSEKHSGDKTYFSFADSHLEAKKRLTAILLAKKLYADAGRAYDAESDRPVEMKAGEADRDFVYMQDMSFLDEDVDWIVARAEAVAYRLANSYDKKAVGDAELERRAKAEERSFQNSHIVEACVRDALEKREKALNVRERLKAKEKREAQKERGFSVDELLIAGIEIDAAIFDAAEGSGALEAVDAEVDKAFEFVQNRATDKGLDIDSDGYVAMLSKTMANSLRSAALELPYGRGRAAAMKGIAGLSGIAAGETIARRAKKLGRKLAEYLKRDAQRLSDAEEAAFMKEYSRAKKEAERKRKSEEEFSKLRQKMRDLKREHRRRRMLAEIEGRLKKYSKKPTRAHASKRKINALVEWYLAAAKSYIELTPEELSEEKRKLEGKSFDYEYDAAYNRIEIEALSMFGALKYSDIARVASALDYLRGVVLRGKVEHMQKVLEFQEAAARDAKTLAAGLAARGKNVAGKGGSMLAQSAGEGSSVFRHTLENVFLNNLKDGSAEKAEVSVLSNELATNVSRFALEERRLQTEDMEWLHKAGIEIYGSENAMSRELLEHKDEYRKYSTHGGLVSKANLLAWVAMLEQESMQTARRIMDSEVWEDEESGGGKEKIRDGAGRALYMRFENLEAMKAELSDRDMEFLDAIKKRWSNRFPKISQAIGELTGAPLQSVSADYFPIVREGDIDLSRVSGAKSKIPGYIIPRTVSFKNIDDDADILSIFSKRAQEDAHLLAYRDFGFRIDAIFKAKPIQDAMKQYMTNIERDEFVRFVDQSVNGKEYFAQTAESKLLSAITSATAFAGLGWNPVSAIKQLTGAVSFGLEVGAVQNIKDIVWAVGTPEGRRAFMEVFNSEYMRVRRGGALNPGLEHAMREFGEGKYGNGMSAVKRLIAKTRPFAMTAGMDSVASSLGGAAIYMRFLEAHSVSHDMDEARRLAMLDFMEIVERTQQSSLTHNQSSFLRNHGFIGRAVMQFKSNPQLFFSYEVKAVREWWNDRGNIEKFKRLCSVIAINHFIIPASFNGMGVLLSFLMGDDWDDEDLKFFMMSTATDVLSGWWLGGIIKGIAATAAGMNNRDLTSEILPAAGLARIGNQVGLILRDFTRGEFGDNYEKRLKNLFKAAFPPGRYALKIYDNATDNKEGVLW